MVGGNKIKARTRIHMVNGDLDVYYNDEAARVFNDLTESYTKGELVVSFQFPKPKRIVRYTVDNIVKLEFVEDNNG